MGLAVKKGFPADISRKIIHIAAGSWIIFWMFYDLTHWSMYFNIAPAFILTIVLLHKIFFAAPGDKAVKTMTRSGDKKELLRGPLLFAIVMNIMGTIFFYEPAAISVMAFLGWGDGIAPIVGKLYGRKKIKLFAVKTFEGSLAFNLAGIAAAIGFHFALTGEAKIIKIVLVGAIATLVEAASPKDLDNIFIPASILLLYLLI